MPNQIIKPRSNKQELLFILIVTVSVILIASLFISLRKMGKSDSGIQNLKKYQISAFSGLTKKEQLLFTALYASGFEINNYHITNYEDWPTISKLDDMGIPPYVRDRAWKNSGSYIWSRKRAGNKRAHIAVFYGRPEINGKTGNYILIMEHFHGLDGSYQSSVDSKNPFRIWYDKSGRNKFPKRYTVSYMIANGWKEIVAYRGKDEVKRLGRR